MSNDGIETRVETSEGEISFQEYFVKRRWQPEVRKVFYAGVKEPSGARCARSYWQRRRDHHLSEQSCDQYRPDPGGSWH